MLSRLHSSHDAAAARRQTVASLLASYSTCFSRLELLADPLGEFWSLRNDPSNCWLTIHVQRLVHALSASASYGTARQACLPCHVYSHTAIVGACVRAVRRARAIALESRRGHGRPVARSERVLKSARQPQRDNTWSIIHSTNNNTYYTQYAPQPRCIIPPCK